VDDRGYGGQDGLQGGNGMLDWNVIATSESGRDRDLLHELNQWGEFRRPGFRGVVIGRVADVNDFLEAVRRAGEQQLPWVEDMARAFPIERLFHFTPETFEEQLKQAVAPFVERMAGGTFYVRLERRGFKGRIVSPEVERALDTYVISLAAQQGKTLQVSFEDPDYVVVAETINDMCGVALLTRELRARYPFMKIR
jgi:tRNA(Ser,Leu) C12 N-acetylase TAN1